MKHTADSRRVLITIPLEVRDWLRDRAKYNGGSLSGELVGSAREPMERERSTKDRTTTAAE